MRSDSSEKYGMAETAIQSLAALRRISANTDERVVVELYNKRIDKTSQLLLLRWKPND